MPRSRRLQGGGEGVAPGDCAGIHAGGPGGVDVAEFVADADGVGWPGSEVSRDAAEFVVLAED